MLTAKLGEQRPVSKSTQREDGTPVAIIGAGPYGLSIAAHLRARSIPHRVFGVPMETWRSQMPRGMFLKSEGFASNLSDADGAASLAAFCSERGLSYADVGVPVALETFSVYGLEFAARFAPDLDSRKVERLERTPTGFLLTLEDGAVLEAARVIVAVGISHFRWLPSIFEGVPERFVTHSSAHHRLEEFAGKRVTVIGSGASAVDVAGLLHETGARTELVARAASLTFHDPPKLDRSLYERLRRPRSGLGPSLKSKFYSDYPDLFALLPAAWRVRIVRRAIGPSACYFTRAQIEGKVRTHVGRTIESLEIAHERVRLHVRDRAGARETIESDHVIAGTGYRVDLTRVPFLPDDIRTSLKLLDGSPVLDRNFQSTVRGLYFVGVSAAVSFGPLLRFAFGARFAATRLASRLGATTRRAMRP